MDPKIIIEAALLTAGQPLSVDRLLAVFDESERPPRDEVRRFLETLREEWSDRGVELKEVSSGYRFQAKQDLSPWLSRLSEERRPRYSRALMETLALIAYRQPISRAEIEDVRGVAVSSHIIKTLLDRDWVRVVGHRDVPGRPALFGTTKQFLDQFNLKSLAELPPLAEVSSLEHLQVDLDLGEEGVADEALLDDGVAVVAREDDASRPEGSDDVQDTHYPPASNG
jgi:segregation and condensation protein B